MVFVRLLTQPPPVPPTGRTFLIELARLLDVPINGNDDMVDVEKRIAVALCNHLTNGENPMTIPAPNDEEVTTYAFIEEPKAENILDELASWAADQLFTDGREESRPNIEELIREVKAHARAEALTNTRGTSMTLDLDQLKRVANDSKRWPTNAELGELRYGLNASIARIEELEAEKAAAWHIARTSILTGQTAQEITQAVSEMSGHEATLQRVRDARSSHPEIPECDRYADDDAIKCGWRSAIESIDKALEGDQK